MKTSSDVQLRMTVSHLDVERTALKRELLSYLRGMARDIESALADVETNSSINSNLMQHAHRVAEQVGCWNLIRNLTPYLKEEEALKPSTSTASTEPTEDEVAALAGEERSTNYGRPLKPADTIYNDPEGGPIMRRVQETFDVLTKARNRQSRVSRPDAVRIAAIEYKVAEKEYRNAADARDRFVEIWNARKTQRSVAP